LFFCVTVDHFIRVLLANVVFGSVSSVPSQETGWEGRLRNNLVCVLSKTLTQSINQSIYT